MSQLTATRRNATDISPHSGAARAVRPDIYCWARATEFLTKLIGSPPDDLQWDDTHHLQGHGHLNGHELVVIAPRDDDHQTIVLTPEDWDAVRRAATDQRRDLLTAYAIADRHQLDVALTTCEEREREMTTALRGPGATESAPSPRFLE